MVILAPGVEHSGIRRERLALRYELPQPIELRHSAYRGGRETLWRFMAVIVTHNRGSEGPGSEWEAWRTRVTGVGGNVLKSGMLGVLRPTAVSLGSSTWRDPATVTPADWCAEWLQPILDDAAERRDASAWGGAW